MILADTSVWINHFRSGNPTLAALLEESRIGTHPFVIGELSCGSLRNRAKILSLLEALPQVRIAGQREVLRLVENERLYGCGIGWIDAHLLASALLSDAIIWTLDRSLSKIAIALGIAGNA